MPCYSLRQFRTVVDEEYLCAVCGGVMDVPMQLACGHDCGRDCVSERCAVRGCEKIVSDPQEMARLGRLISKLAAHCDRCDWIGPCGEISSHECPNDMLECVYHCGRTVARCDMSHHRTECVNREESCRHCFRTMRLQLLPMHDERCPMKELPCSQCSKLIRRGDLSSHIKDDCLLTAVTCPFSEFGCDTLVRRKDLEGHLATSVGAHCAALVTAVRIERTSSATEIASLSLRVRELEQELEGKATLNGEPLGSALQRIEDQMLRQQELIDVVLGGRMLTVDCNRSCGMFSTINCALRACQSGDVIVVRPGVYTEVVELLPHHVGVTLKGTSTESVFLSGRLIVKCDAVVSTMSIINRTDRNSPALWIEGSPHLSDVHVSSVNLSCCVVEGGAPTFTSCNMSSSMQHALWWRSPSHGTATGCSFSDCAQCCVAVERGTLLCVECDIFGSKSNGVSVRGSDEASRGSLIARGCAFHDNGLSNIEVQATGSATLQQCSSYRSEKCGLFCSGDVTVDDSKIFENRLPNIIIVHGGAGRFTRCKILCGLQHGVVVKRGGSATLASCVVSGNCLDNIAAEEGATVHL